MATPTIMSFGSKKTAILGLFCAAIVLIAWLLWPSTVRETRTQKADIEEAFDSLSSDAKIAMSVPSTKADYIKNFSLAPANLSGLKGKEARAVSARAEEAIRSFLLVRKTGGAKMWFDPATHQLTIVDSQENAERVAEFIEDLGFLPPDPHAAAPPPAV